MMLRRNHMIASPPPPLLFPDTLECEMIPHPRAQLPQSLPETLGICRVEKEVDGEVDVVDDLEQRLVPLCCARDVILLLGEGQDGAVDLEGVARSVEEHEHGRHDQQHPRGLQLVAVVRMVHQLLPLLVSLSLSGAE